MTRVFEHLDDRTDPSPGDPELGKVMRRMRRRQRRTQLLSMGAATLLVVGVFAGIIALRTSGTPLATSETVYQFDSSKGPLAVGAPVPTTALLDVDFASPTNGFALAAHNGQAILAASTDGGSTWIVQNSDLPSAFDQNNGFPGQIEFIGSHGYLWGKGEGVGGEAPLLVSDDSGQSWITAPIGPDVFDVSAIGSNIWALASTCDVSLSSPCPLNVEISTDWGDTWQIANGTSFMSISGLLSGEQPVELARITTSRAYVLTSGTTFGSATSLLFTADSGASWVTLPVPCAGPYNLGAEIAASSTEDLWLLCGGQGSGGEQSKELFRSSNGGMTWSLASSASGAGSGGQLPLAGYVAPFSTGHKNLAVASASTAWLKASGSTLYVTHDGGSTWKAVPDLLSADFPGSGQGNVTFISGTQGWISAYGVGLWRTTDGVTWTHLGS